LGEVIDIDWICIISPRDPKIISHPFICPCGSYTLS